MAATQATGGSSIPPTAAVYFPFRAATTQKARLPPTVITNSGQEESSAPRGTVPIRAAPPMIAAKMIASTDWRPSSAQ